MRAHGWTLAEQNWSAAIATEIRRRIDEGQYVPANEQPPAYLHHPDDPFDPDLLSKKQLQGLLDEVEKAPEPDLNWHGTLFRVPNPHA